jgi:hypothetical protein
MLLGPRSFADVPALPTYTLPGQMSNGGVLSFTPDDRHLLVAGSSGMLEVWELATRRRVYWQPDLGVAAVVLLGGPPGELLLAVEDEDGTELRVARARLDGSELRTLVGGLPGLQPDDFVLLREHAGTALVATTRWARWCNLATGAVTGRLDYQHDGPSRAVVAWGELHLQQTNMPSLRNEAGDYTSSLWSADGSEVARLSWRRPGLDRFRGLTVAAGPDGAVALLGGPDLFRVRPLDGYVPGMGFCVSRGGRTITGGTPDRLAVWREGELAQTFACDGTGYTAWPSDDGRLLTLVYDPGHLGIPSGVLDLTTGRVLGRCNWHVALFCWAYSHSNRYVASLMTDSHYNYQAGLEGGTIVVTELPAADPSGPAHR